MATAKEQAEIAKFAAEARLANLTADLRELEIESTRREFADEDVTADAQRIYDFSETVSAKSVQECIDVLTEWRKRSADPITVRFTSPGGGVLPGLALYDYLVALRAEGIHITTVALGYAASMAGILLQAGTHRLVGPNAYILIHEVSSGAIGKISELKDETKFADALWKRLSELLAARSTLSALQVRNRADRRDWWLDADDAVELGFADGKVEA